MLIGGEPLAVPHTHTMKILATELVGSNLMALNIQEGRKTQKIKGNKLVSQV